MSNGTKMHVSFNGVLVPYTYNCEYAHYLRNIRHIYPERVDESELSDEEKSRRRFGLEQHELCSKYIDGELEEYEYATDTINWCKEQGAITEEQKFYGLDMQVLSAKPEVGHYVSTRKDAVVRTADKVTILDWKFGNPEYGAPKYYDEVEFFLAFEAAEHYDVGEWEVVIHFPHVDYTLQKRTYTCNQVANIMSNTLDRIDRILNRKLFRPNPGRLRCRFCDQRSEDTGGTGACEHTVL